MTKHLPMDDEQILRGAKEWIEQHGDSALERADKQISVCESSGFYSVAETWKLLRNTIKKIQQSNSVSDSCTKILNKGTIFSE